MDNTVDLSQATVDGNGNLIAPITKVQLQAYADNLEAMMSTNIQTIAEATAGNVDLQPKLDKANALLAQIN